MDMPGLKKAVLIFYISVSLCLLTFIPARAYSEMEPVLEHFSVGDGLSQAHINHILQDRQGFIWLATLDGLNRYDGYSFQVYRHDADDPYSLSSNSIQTLYEDSSGLIWVGTDGGGINVFDPAVERFTSYKKSPHEEDSLSHNNVLSIFEDRQGNFWVGTARGLNKFLPESETFQLYLPEASITAIAEDISGSLWIGTQGSGLFKFDQETGHFKNIEPDPGIPGGMTSYEIYCFHLDNSGNLWAGTRGQGVLKIDLEKESVDNIRAEHEHDNYIFSIFADSRDRLWMATLGGLYVFNTDNNAFEEPFISPELSLLHELETRSVFEDNSHIIWVGSRTGVFKINPNKSKFKTYSLAQEKVPPGYTVITSIYEAGEDIFWVGTEKGLYTFNQGSRKFELYSSSDDTAGFLSTGQIGSISQGLNNTIWVPTVGGGLYQLDENHKLINHFEANSGGEHSLESDFVSDILIDSRGIHWVGTLLGGLHVLDPATGEFHVHRAHAEDPETISSNDIIFIYEDAGEDLWVGTYYGLNRFDREENRFYQYLADPAIEDSISNNTVFSMFQDSRGIIWVGTMDGLNRYDPGTDSFKTYTISHGLPNNVILSILEDDKGYLWMSTNLGLSRFNVETEDFANFDIQDGLASNDFSIGAGLKREDGEIIFAGTRGLNFFHPQAIEKNPHLPEVVITDFKVMNDPVPIKDDERAHLNTSITRAQKVHLYPGDHFFSFEFAGLEFTDPDRNKYAFMLEGFDQDWNYSGNRRFASYTNIPPGQYRFKVKAANNDGVWNEVPTVLNVMVHPPFWQTWWFQALVGIMLLILIIRQYRRIQNRSRYLENLVAQRTESLALAKQEAEEARQVAETTSKAKSRLLAITSHELRNPLTGIVNLANRLTQDNFDPEQSEYANIIKTSGNFMLTIVNDLLDLSKIESGNMEMVKEPFDLKTLLEEIVKSFSLMSQEKNIELHYYIDPAIPENLIGDSGKINRIVMNLLDNAIKYTTEGRVTFRTNLLTLKSKTAEISLQIEDTGMGIPEEKLGLIFKDFEQINSNIENPKGTGLGLSIADKLARMMGGSITVKSQEGEGSCFECRLELEISDQASSQDQIAEKPWESEYSPPQDRVLKILVAEDEPVVQNYLQILLGELNHQVFLASSGREALELFRSEFFDCILMDIYMPDISGLEVTKIIRKEERKIKSHTPIIAITASTLPEEKEAFWAAGVDYFVSKPINERNLKEILHKIGYPF